MGIRSLTPAQPKVSEKPTTLSVVPVQFEASTGNVHLDQAIEFAAEMAMGRVKRMLIAEMTSALKAAIEMDGKYPRPKRGSILNRGTCVDKVCQCGRVVTFPLHEPPESDPLADHPQLNL